MTPTSAIHIPSRGRFAVCAAFIPAVLGTLACGAGCATGSRTVPPAGSPSLAPGVDTQRAFLPLEQIEPAVSAPSPSAAPKPLSERAAAQVAVARKLIDEQRFTEAALELEKALRYDPNHPAIHRTLAQMHWQAGNLERARSHAARTLELQPDDAQAHYLLGRALSAAGDRSGAIAAFRRALLSRGDERHEETMALCQHALAQDLAADGYLTAALAAYDAFERSTAGAGAATGELAALLRAPGTAVTLARADLLEKLGRPAEAADVVAHLAMAAPQDADLQIRYARLLLAADRGPQALAVVRAVNTVNDDVLDLLGDIHQRQGDAEGLVADLRRLREAHPGQTGLLLRLAEALVNRGRPAEAERMLREHLATEGESADVRLQLVDLALRRNDPAAALEQYAAGIVAQPAQMEIFEQRVDALASSPDVVAALTDAAPASEPAAASYLRGRLAWRAGRWATAERWLERAIETDATLVPARVVLGDVYVRTNRFDDALRIAARSEPDIVDDPRLEMILGDANDRLDRFEPAELHYRAAIQRQRDNTDAMFALARLYQRSDRLLLAQRQLRALLGESPAHEAAREMLAFLYLREGKNDAAVQQFEELRKTALTPTTKARAAAFLDQYPRIDPPTYRAALLTAMNESRPDAATWLAVADSYDQVTEIAERYEAFRQAAALEPDNEEAALGLITAAQGLLRHEEAIERLRELLPRRPNRHAWRLGLIELHWTVQDYESAISMSRGLAERDALDSAVRTRYRLRWADSLRLADRLDEAITLVRRWAEEATTDKRAWMARLAELLTQAERHAEVVTILEGFLRDAPSDTRPRSDLVQALVAAERRDRAAQIALDWLAEDPDNHQPVALLVFALEGNERIDDINELIRNTLLLTPYRETFQDLLSVRLRLAGRHEAAIDFIEGLIDQVVAHLQRLSDRAHAAAEPSKDIDLARQPNEPYTMDSLADRLMALRLELAQAHVQAGNFREAEQMLLGWLETAQDPDTRLRLHLSLAFCYQAQGDDLRSTEAMAQAHALRPDNVGLNNDVAYGWIDRGIRMAEAERMIRYAVSRAPREGAYLDTYGWLLYKKGEFAEARKWLLRAARERSFNDPVVLDHLGDACWRLGERDQALEHWRAAVRRLNELPKDEVRAADIVRVRDVTPEKIEKAGANADPPVAPLAMETTPSPADAPPAPP